MNEKAQGKLLYHIMSWQCNSELRACKSQYDNRHMQFWLFYRYIYVVI